MEIQALKTQRIVDMVRDVLRDKILTQEVKPGEKLSPEWLSRQFGVSRSPIQEALTLLATEGLVEIIPRKGSFVAVLSKKEMAEMMDMRRALEWVACEGAVQNVSAKDLHDLRQMLIEMQALASSDLPMQERAKLYSTKNLEFHSRIVQLSENQSLIDAYRGLKNLTIQSVRAQVSAGHWITRLDGDQAEHLEIVTALEQRDEERLKTAVDRHLKRAKSSLVGDIEEVLASGDAARSAARKEKPLAR